MVQTRLEALRRLASLYAAVEQLHSAELQRTTAALRQAQHAIQTEQEMARSVRNEGRGALLAGDQMSWMMAETEQESSAWRRRGLDQIRLEREELSEVAREQYVASRLKREQTKRVFDDMAAGMEIEEGRRLQAESNDRFLARRRWTDEQTRLRDKRRMRAS
jgi:hypothetical protein